MGDCGKGLINGCRNSIIRTKLPVDGDIAQMQEFAASPL
jgi:hypothetical protein